MARAPGTLRRRAATTATTCSPLHIETDLDQFNPADGSQSNLDYAGPGDVPVVASSPSIVTFRGTLTTTGGSGVLTANICTVAPSGPCSLTGTATLTPTGGTLTGTITANLNNPSNEETITFTETFVNTSPTTQRGMGTGQAYFAASGTTVPITVRSFVSITRTAVPSVVIESGIITIS